MDTSTDRKPMTELKQRIDILAELSYAYTAGNVDENLAKFCDIWNITIPLAFAVGYEYAVLTDKGANAINEVFDKLLTLANVEDTGFDELSDILG
jgi:hypothetical protein